MANHAPFANLRAFRGRHHQEKPRNRGHIPEFELNATDKAPRRGHCLMAPGPYAIRKRAAIAGMRES
jgi:hypothetical protein